MSSVSCYNILILCVIFVILSWSGGGWKIKTLEFNLYIAKFTTWLSVNYVHYFDDEVVNYFVVIKYVINYIVGTLDSRI